MSFLTRPALSAAVVALAAGCSTHTEFVSRRAPDANLSPRRIFVASHLLDARTGANFGDEFAAGFDRGLEDTLKRCNVESLVRESTGPELDGSQLVKQVEAFRPDTLVTLEKTHGTVDRTTHGLLSATYAVELLEMSAAGGRKTSGKEPPLKTMWRSTMFFTVGGSFAGTRAQKGAQMATALVAQMQQDGFFPGCAVEATTHSRQTQQ
jgi:hypothetical protein